jgi:2-polyprenyl-3-methyl-5-hydroxy-6-metoxy-1,4-benzoquinol methylase
MSLTSASAKHATWYDEHYYRNVRLTLGPWHRLLLPNLIAECRPDHKLIELGCGQAQVPRLLVEKGCLLATHIYGVDQSSEAVAFCRSEMAAGHFEVQDLYAMHYPANMFDFCVMLETIEHLEHPEVVLAHIHKMLKPGGCLYISFPNFLHLPWFAVRLLAEWLNRPNWIGLQPVDKIYTIFGIKKLAHAAGFEFVEGIGSGYGPPLLDRLEKEWMTHIFNCCGIWWLSFHPIMKFRKPFIP